MLLRAAGHRVTITTSGTGPAPDLLLALHARRSHDAIRRFRGMHPERPLIVALTGTDVYRDIRVDAASRQSMRWADRMIVLQGSALDELEPALRDKTRIVHQSAVPIARKPPLTRVFEVCVVGHLRDEKDPFRTALASERLSTGSRARIVHLGRALDPAMEREAHELQARNPRYRWRGEVPHWAVRRIMARARLMVISSRMEGGANVVSEALAADLPVIASRIPGNVGILGADYPGYYAVEDDVGLAALIERAETDPRFLAALRQHCRRRRPLFDRAREASALLNVVSEAVRQKR
jgi:putative glycosyltransferase (TIGR04348 family)